MNYLFLQLLQHYFAVLFIRTDQSRSPSGAFYFRNLALKDLTLLYYMVTKTPLCKVMNKYSQENSYIFIKASINAPNQHLLSILGGTPGHVGEYK